MIVMIMMTMMIIIQIIQKIMIMIILIVLHDSNLFIMLERKGNNERIIKEKEIKNKGKQMKKEGSTQERTK